MKNKFTIILIAILMSCNLHAQDTTFNSLRFSMGMGHLMIQDLTFSPFIHQSYSPLAISLEYQRSKKLEQFVSFSYSGYKARIGDEFTYTSFRDSTKSYQTYPHVFNRIQLNYALGKTIFHTDKLSLSAGGRSNNRIYLSSYTFGNNGSFGYYFNLGLDVWIRSSYNISEKQLIEANIFLPLFSYNARSPYLSQDDEFFQDIYSHSGLKSFKNYLSGGEFQTWNKNQYIDLDISYWYYIKTRWGIGARYIFSMGFNQYPTKYSFIENKLGVQATYKF